VFSLKPANDIFEPATPPYILSTKYMDAIFLARNFELTVRTKTIKSQWKIIEPTRFEVQYYSNNADDTGEYRTCRIDVVVVVNKVEKERTAVMDDACCWCCCEQLFAGWTPNSVGPRRVYSEF
jgi:hypothetical protein